MQLGVDGASHPFGRKITDQEFVRIDPDGFLKQHLPEGFSHLDERRLPPVFRSPEIPGPDQGPFGANTRARFLDRLLEAVYSAGSHVASPSIRWSTGTIGSVVGLNENAFLLKHLFRPLPGLHGIPLQVKRLEAGFYAGQLGLAQGMVSEEVDPISVVFP